MTDHDVYRAAPILALIRKHEADGAIRAQGAASAYDVVSGFIAPAQRPAVPLTKMTVAEVLEWQTGLQSRSTAAGAYQIIRRTLLGLMLPPSAQFDSYLQDRAAMQLLDRRGWSRLLNGEMTPTRFGDALAREWASLPVLTDQRGHSRQVKRGQSYYAGDGLNKAHAKPAEVEVAIMQAYQQHDIPVDPLAAWWASAPPGVAEWLSRAPVSGKEIDIA